MVLGGTMDGELVTFPSDNPSGEGNGVVFGSGSKGLIVVPDFWGMNDEVEELGATVAQQGDYMVLIIDHNHAKTENNNEEPAPEIKDDHHVKTDWEWKEALSETRAGVKYLKERGCHKVGIVGFGDGGALALLVALRSNEISAVSSFYGFPGVEQGDLTRIRIPIQGHFAKRDSNEKSSPMRFIPFREKSKACGVPLEYHAYDAGHGFANQKSHNYNEELAKEAMSSMHEFMEKKLK